MITKFPLPLSSYFVISLFAFTIFLSLFSLFLLVSSFCYYTCSVSTLLYFFVSLITFSLFTFSISLLVSIFSVASKDVRNLVALFVNSIFGFQSFIPSFYPTYLTFYDFYFLRSICQSINRFY